MDNIENDHKRRCEAMIAAGIEDPDSTEGIVFCAGDRFTESRCPYPYCVVFEHTSRQSIVEAKARAKFARQLHEHGVSTKDIALIVRRNETTVRDYYRKG